MIEIGLMVISWFVLLWVFGGRNESASVDPHDATEGIKPVTARKR